MGLRDCQIQLDNPWNTYYAGQTVNGQVVLNFDSVKKVRGILIRFLGEANTSWSETRKTTNSDGKEEDETEYFTAHEQYFQTQYYLLGGKSSKETELAPGSHTYPFTCALPTTLPSSIEGKYGHVRYTIKVILDRPWKFDQEIKMAFTVITPVDLNLNARVKESVKLPLEKTFCCFCCRSGPLSVVVYVPVTGFVSGQVIPITCECDNASNVHINSVKFVMRKMILFRANQPRSESNQDRIVIAELSVGPVPPGESKTWNQQLKVPPLPPSNLVNCSIIDVDYELHIDVDVAGPHQNLKGSIPIVLGTIPLSTFKPPVPENDIPVDVSMLPTQPVSPASPPNGTGGALGWNVADSGGGRLYPNIPPPSFNESDSRGSIADKQDSEHTQLLGDDFAPRYPTYQFTQQY